MSCMLVGGEDDRVLNDQCLSGVQDKNNRNVVGTFDLIEYAALCSKASLFIGNESGPLHIAAYRFIIFPIHLYMKKLVGVVCEGVIAIANV